MSVKFFNDGMMEKFENLITTAVPLLDENIDTDQIIPARFLKAITRNGFGENLFRDWRYKNGVANPDFPLNDPVYTGKILIAGRNFGCGSSREHAAWAILDYGFKAVVSSFFADIFKSNALNNGLLPVQVSEPFLGQLMKNVQNSPKTLIEIDLQSQTISILNSSHSESFEITAFKKQCLLNGQDDFEFLLDKRESVEKYEMMNKIKPGE